MDRLRDGEGVRVPLVLMDAARDHQPHYVRVADDDRVSDLTQLRDRSRAARERWIADQCSAWKRGPARDFAEPSIHSSPEDLARMRRHLFGADTPDDRIAARQAAYERARQKQANAWRNTPGTMTPQPSIVGLGPTGFLKAAESPDPVARANAIQRQGEKWRAGR
jgi:hypothetical protein